MTNRRSVIKSNYGVLIIGITVLAGLYIISRYSYLLYHSFAEVFSIIIAAGIFMVAWNSRKFLDNNYLLFIGIAYIFIAFLDLIHMLAYKGMNVFLGYGPNLPTQLWIFTRYIESITLVVAIIFINRKLKHGYIFLGYSLVVIIFLLSIFYWNIFPDAFIEGIGLTSFKVISEYIISFMLLISILLLYLKRAEFNKTVFKLMVASIIITVFSELAFTLYSDVYGITNQIGHYLKIISFYLIYKAIIQTGLVKPFDLLFRRLKKSEQALKEKSTRLELVNKELESFAYSVSHDLKAPLRRIDGFSRILLEDYSNKLDKQGKDFLNRVCVSTTRMSELITDLLTLSRVTRKELKLDRINLSQLAEDVVKDLKAIQPDRKVEFEITSGLSVIADIGLIRIALENLLGNAFKFTKKKKNPEIKMGLTSINGRKAYFISDNGEGFDMTYVDKLFVPFQRIHSESEFEGTGIGLAIVQRIMNMHNGEIWAESKVGEGAIFYFSF